MNRVHISIDGNAVTAQTGSSVLEAALGAGLYIPHLCHWPLEGCSSHVGGSSCRLCFVEVEGLDRPVCACEQEVDEGMRVKTRGTHARQLAAAAFELLMAEHTVSCAVCPRNGEIGPCELKAIARWLDVPLKSRWQLDAAQALRPEWEIDGFKVNHEKCIHCGRCIRVCETSGNRLLGFAARGLDAYVGYGGSVDTVQDLCARCQKCMLACPAGAILVMEPLA